MAASNTEKPTGKNETKKQVAPKVPKVEKKQIPKAPVKKETKEEKVSVEKKPEDKAPEKTEAKKIEVKKIKKTQVSVNVNNVSASTKYCSFICKFIKNKKIKDAIADLEQVQILKKAVPMKGEIPHRKGKIMSGRFPKRAAKEFVILLKSLEGNSNQHDLEEAIICEAVANKGSTVYGRRGMQKKRTNIRIVAKEKKLIKQRTPYGRTPKDLKERSLQGAK